MIRKIRLSIIIVIISFLYLHADEHFNQNLRNLDSLYNMVLRIKNVIDFENESFQVDHKCGFGIINSVKLNLNSFPLDKRIKLQNILQRPSTQKTLISPGGRFKIHYDTTGSNAVTYSAFELARAIDSVYNYEVNYMGFPPAPPDLNGGDDLYDIYIQNLGSTYGYTEIEFMIGDQRFTSFMVIDNSFHEDGFYTKGIDAARVTVAHEYHHAIQIGNFIYKESDIWFHELTSTSMEEFVFDSVNDYYGYIRSFFNAPHKIFTNHDGYSQAIWNIYLMKIFGNYFSILVNQWNYLKNLSALESIRKSIEDKGKSFRSVFSEFFLYNYYTGYRSNPDEYYEEGSNYPLIRTELTRNYNYSQININGKSQPCAAHYFLVVDSVLKKPFPPDSIMIILVNTNLEAALDWDNTSDGFDYAFSISKDSSEQFLKRISTNLFSRFQLSDPTNWKDFVILNNTKSVQPIVSYKNFAFPMPVNFSKSKLVNIPLPSNWVNANEVELIILSSSMDLVYKGKKVPQVFEDKLVVNWDGKDLNEKQSPSGIFFYVAINEEEKSTGKIVILNE